MSVLTVYSGSFPYGTAETFLETEISVLSRHFETIYIVPFKAEKGEARIVPGNVRVLSPIQIRKWPAICMYATGFLSSLLILKIPELRDELKRNSILKAIKYLGFAVLTKNRLSKVIPAETTLHYSYWLNFSSFSLALLKREGRIQTLVSRAHGFDLYEERGEKALIFLRAATLKYCDKIYLISEHGRKYILKIIPRFSQKYVLSRLGTSDPGHINIPDESSGLTLVSCSAIDRNKRVGLILDSLILFNNRFPGITVRWYHLGGGSDISVLEDRAENSLRDSSVSCLFRGQLMHNEILNFYRSVSIDLFVNVSESEGLPVAIMEAQSFGIPVMATAAGGIPEIVNNKNGMLLPSDPSSTEIADALYRVSEEKEEWKKKRLLSRKNWEENFNAINNYTAFASELLSLA